MIFYCEEENLMPFKKYESDAGWDIKAKVATIVMPFETVIVNSGVYAEMPHGFVGKIYARSSVLKKGVIIDGTIDSGYRGEIGIIIQNNSGHIWQCERNERIAQLVIIPILQKADFRIGKPKEDTERGAGGFGSTGS
jgi:dUTP pyrophosphatase